MNFKNEINELISYAKKNKDIYEVWSGAKTRYACFFGIGKIFSAELYMFENAGCNINFLCDNDPEKWGKKFFGYTCISPAELESYGHEDVMIVIDVSNFFPIYDQLKDMGFKYVYPAFRWMMDDCKYFVNSDWIEEARDTIERTIDILGDELSQKTYLSTIRDRASVEFRNPGTPENIASLIEDEEYFVDDIFKLGPDECFVDGGAYVGDTLQSFIEHTDGVFSHAYLFELSKDNYNKLTEYIKTLSPEIRRKITAYNIGLWDCKKSILCNGNDMGITAHEDSTGSSKDICFVDSLDNILGDKRITFIKMDIEGAEIKALSASRRIIETHKPKLAICSYHRLEHLIKIPEIIKRLNPEYKVYCRHHAKYWAETICYAV